MKKKKMKPWLTFLIVCCLIVIQFAAMATKVNTEDEGRSAAVSVPQEPSRQKEQNPSPDADNRATAVHAEGISEDTVAPVIKHKAVKKSKAYTDITIKATVRDDTSVPYATLHYKKAGDETFTSLAMQDSARNSARFSVVIPSQVVEADLIYYIEATDGKNNRKTAQYKISVSKPKLNFNQIPPLLITEVVPDSTNVDEADGYEFIEIYNNTDQDINFKDYKMQYRYGTDPETDVIWESVPNDFVIRSKGTVVFWIIYDKNKAKTVADFNEHYHTDLVENKDIVKIHSAGMANSGLRGIVIATNTDKEISVAYYNEETEVDDTIPDKGIFYAYPVNKTNKMRKLSGGQVAATPGSVSSSQVPPKAVTVPKDTVAPTIEDVTEKAEIKQWEDLNITADVKDNMIVKTVALYYKNNKQTTFKKVLLPEDKQDLLYHFNVHWLELIAKKSIEYYYVVSDGTNEIQSDTYKVTISREQNLDPLRLNVKNEEIISGEKIIKASSEEGNPEKIKLSINQKELVTDTYYTLENEGYFAFEVSGVNTFFQNGVTMGDEILRIIDDGISKWQTIVVPIQADKLTEGANVITIRSGDKATPFPTNNGENRDDYSLRNVRLVLADGTVIKDPLHHDAEKVIAMNDANPAVDFTLTIPAEKMTSKTYKWDTTKVADGEYTIRATDAVNPEAIANIKVDNTAPVIETNIEKAKTYKGPFTIQASATDALAGLDTTEVKLDGETISIPYETSSAKLAPGSHTLLISAVDKVGNKTELSVSFTTVDELPAKPELVSPEDDSQQTSPVLKVHVTDPTNDDMKVSFYQGFQYDATNVDQMKIFKNAADTEPPQTMIPAGETALVNEEVSKIAASDNEYLVTDSETQFPYHRFDVAIDSSVDETDVVELSWEGHSLEGRKVSMYAWSQTKNGWVMLDTKIAGAEDFTLTKNVSVAEFLKDSKVNVLVQDEIPASSADYDYTFVWMSDTQYYSESYPYIFDRQTQWIVENQAALKIKYVFHTGDLVDESDKEVQWNNASNAMKTLDDAHLPYGVLAGNHDVDHKTSDYTQFYRFFGEDRYKDRPYYGGSYKNNRGHYDLLSVSGNDYIMVYMGWGVDAESIAWINEVLAEYPDRKAILSFHEYLLSTGTRHPLGEQLFNQVVVPNKNVMAVLSGHYHEAQVLVDPIDDNGDGGPDRNVYQLLADYQAGPEGGQGYLRLLHFDQDQNRIIVNTYSPYLNDYNYYDTDKYANKDEFTMDLNLEPQQKRIATDSFTVRVYTDSLIGAVDHVTSGSDAETTWNGLAPNQVYSWYAVAEDDFTGRTVSDIWSFTVPGTIAIKLSK